MAWHHIALNTKKRHLRWCLALYLSEFNIICVLPFCHSWCFAVSGVQSFVIINIIIDHRYLLHDLPLELGIFDLQLSKNHCYKWLVLVSPGNGFVSCCPVRIQRWSRTWQNLHLLSRAAEAIVSCVLQWYVCLIPDRLQVEAFFCWAISSPLTI